MSAASGGIRLGRGVRPVRSGGRSVSWVGGRAGLELGWRKGWIRAAEAEGLDRSCGGELGLWWMGLRRLAMEEKRETQRENGEENVRREAIGMK